jgi:hypothetical protein
LAFCSKNSRALNSSQTDFAYAEIFRIYLYSKRIPKNALGPEKQDIIERKKLGLKACC